MDALEEARNGVINKEFEKWWNENEKQFTEDSCHMSEFHMASVVWEAAVADERERCAKICDNEKDDWAGSEYETAAKNCAAAIRNQGKQPSEHVDLKFTRMKSGGG